MQKYLIKLLYWVAFKQKQMFNNICCCVAKFLRCNFRSKYLVKSIKQQHVTRSFHCSCFLFYKRIGYRAAETNPKDEIKCLPELFLLTWRTFLILHRALRKVYVEAGEDSMLLKMREKEEKEKKKITLKMKNKKKKERKERNFLLPNFHL